jgi:anti-sigma factor RsiW
MDNLDFDRFTELHDAARVRNALGASFSAEAGCDIASIERYIMDELDKGESEKLEAHLEKCSSCFKIHEAMKEISDGFTACIGEQHSAAPRTSDNRTGSKNEQHKGEKNHIEKRGDSFG